MKLRKLFLATVLLFCAALAQAQQQSNTEVLQGKTGTGNRWLLGIEIGAHTTTGFFLDDKWSIRGSFGFSEMPHSNSIYAIAHGFSLGVKPEFVFNNGRFSVASGLRYLSKVCTLNNHSRFGFFYLRYGESDTDTRFARVRNISENYDFIGVPLEFKWMLIRFSDFPLSFHLQAGAEAYFKLNSDVQIDFVNDFMRSEERKILDYIGVETNDFLARAHLGFGGRYSFNNRMALTMDILFPFFLTENHFALMNPAGGVAVQFSLQIPLTK
jgi:hypothetical protein